MMIDTGGAAAASMSQTSHEGGSKGILEKFHLNKEFRSNQFRLNLPIPQLEEEGSQTKKTKVV